MFFSSFGFMLFVFPLPPVCFLVLLPKILFKNPVCFSAFSVVFNEFCVDVFTNSVLVGDSDV